MAKIGGYQIVDLKNTPITAGGSAVTIPGIYDKIEGTRKRIVISGLVIGSTEYPDTTVEPTVSSGNYVFSAFGYVLTVTDDDEISAVASTLPAGGYTAGTGVAISDGEISGAYTAGTGVAISDGEISGAYTAGTGIKISEGVISLAQE